MISEVVRFQNGERVDALVAPPVAAAYSCHPCKANLLGRSTAAEAGATPPQEAARLRADAGRLVPGLPQAAPATSEIPPEREQPVSGAVQRNRDL